MRVQGNECVGGKRGDDDCAPDAEQTGQCALGRQRRQVGSGREAKGEGALGECFGTRAPVRLDALGHCRLLECVFVVRDQCRPLAHAGGGVWAMRLVPGTQGSGTFEGQALGECRHKGWRCPAGGRRYGDGGAVVPPAGLGCEMHQRCDTVDQEAAQYGCSDRPIGGVCIVCGIWCGEDVPCSGAVFARHSAVNAGAQDERRPVPGTRNRLIEQLGMKQAREVVVRGDPVESILSRRRHQCVDRLAEAIGVLEFGGEDRVRRRGNGTDLHQDVGPGADYWAAVEVAVDGRTERAPIVGCIDQNVGGLPTGMRIEESAEPFYERALVGACGWGGEQVDVAVRRRGDAAVMG